MRLTHVLYKQSHRFHFKQLWKTKAKFTQPLEPNMPSFLTDTGIEAINPSKVDKPPPFPKWTPPVANDPRWTEPPTIKDHPDYHEQSVYHFSPTTLLAEGLQQALLLTKSQPFNGLPASVTELVGRVQLPDQDMLLQRIIMQANVWDPTKEKLLKRVDPSLEVWKFKAEFGIPRSRTASIMVRNVGRLCEMLGSWHPDLLSARRLVIDPYLSSFYYYQGTKHIMIRGLDEMLVSTNKPLAPFASEEIVDQSTSYVLPDLFPLVATIDLDKQHIWKLENITGFRDGYSHVYTHTLFITYDEITWTTSQRNAKALLFCFGHALAAAKQKYGWDVKTLPAPISMQCVMTDGITFNVACFQLNTLDLTSNNGIKNLVWFDNDNIMYNKIIPKRSMLRNTKYEDYDGSVLKKLFALYVNGADLSSTNIDHEQTNRPMAVQANT